MTLQIAIIDRDGSMKVGSDEGVARTLADSLLSEAYKAHVDTPAFHRQAGHQSGNGALVSPTFA